MKSSLEQAKVDIERAAGGAVRVIADAAQEAAKVVASAASEAMRLVNAKSLVGANDHDILIELKTRMEDLKNAVKAISDRDELHITKAEFLEHLKADADHEIRIRKNTDDITKIVTWGTALLVFLAFLEFLVNHFVK